MAAYVPSFVAAAAEAAHRALDAVDDSWHLACLESDEACGPGGCHKGHSARAMLVEDVVPAILDALYEAGWSPPGGELEMRRVPSTPVTFRFATRMRE